MALCSDNIDNDNDGRVDCEDADCRGLVLCNTQPEQELALTPLSPPTPPVSVSTPPIEDLPDAADVGDGSVVENPDDDDAGEDPSVVRGDSCEAISCTTTERCVGGTCIKPVDAGSMMLMQIAILPTSATIISRRNSMGDCLDDDCPTVGTLCLCLPDPYIEIRRNDTVVVKTDVVTDSLNPIWDQAAVAVSYGPDDRLTAVLIDHDEGADADDEIFACDLDPPAQGVSVFSCAGPGNTAGTSTLEVNMTAL